jgi:putative membrane protein
MSPAGDCGVGDIAGGDATLGHGIASHSMERKFTLLYLGFFHVGDVMTKTTQMMCCAALGLAAALLPIKVKADSEGDKKFLAMAAQADQNEIALSKVAAEKATNPNVKAFAETMVKEHTEMSSSMRPFENSWGMTPPPGPDADHQKDLEKLNKLSGKDFDKEYIDIMVSDHAKALNAFTSEAKDTKDAKFQAAVIEGKTAVAAHKNMAYDLKKKL